MEPHRALPAARRRLRSLARRLLTPRTTWHLTIPGADRVLERRWARRIRRAPLLTAEEHAAAVADPARRGAAIEVPTGCVLCGEPRMQPLLRAYDARRARPRWHYHVVRCPACGLLYRHPGIRPERLGDLYGSGRYAKFLAGRYTRDRTRRYETAMRPFGALLQDGAGRRVLDFGCGTGLFLDLAHERGFACFGVDLAADAVAAARRRPGGTGVHHGSPLDVPEIAAGGFDVITMWSVLAHLPRPLEEVAMLRSLLAPDGALLLLTVNAGSLKLRRQLEAWEGFTPNHLVFFSPAPLRRLLRDAGFASVVMPPWYGEPVEDGTSLLTAREQRRLRRAVDRGNRGNMLRAVAFASADGPERWGLAGTPLR